MKDPQYIYSLNTTASLAEVIDKVNEITNTINFMWHPEATGSSAD